MGDTTFEALKLRLGYPYLYSHHGNCEHLMIFRDMRYMYIVSVTVYANSESVVRLQGDGLVASSVVCTAGFSIHATTLP